MTANLDGVPLTEFIGFVSRFTGRSIAFREDQIPSSTVTLRAQKPMSEPQLLAVFESILAGNNLDLISREGIYYVLPGPAAQNINEPFDLEDNNGDRHELVTTVIQTSPRIPMAEASTMLKPFISRSGQLQEVPPARALLIRDTRQNISKLSEILHALENLEPEWDTAMIRLHDAQAGHVAQKVNKLHKDLVQRGQLGDPPVVLPVEWSNSIMAAGSENQIDAVKAIVSGLDEIPEDSSGLKIYALNNARAEDAAEALRQLLTPGRTADQENAQASSSADFVVSADKKTNSVMVMASKQMADRVDQVVAHLDRPLAQVFVEALIVETTLEHSQDFGVEWLGGGGGSDGIITGGFVAPDSKLGPLLSKPAPPVAPGGFSIGALGNTVTYAGQKFSTLGALVNFLKSATDFNILSTPQIMTLDNSEAEIFIGQNRPYLVSERIDPQNNVVQNFDYRDVGIRLLVTPIINSQDSMIRMEVEQEVKTLLDKSHKAIAPITMNRNTRTNVQLPSGSTMVISGLIENAFTQTRQAVPGLSAIPGLGWLFRRQELTAPKTTLMVFLSARIIETLDQADTLTRDRMKRMRESQMDHQELLTEEFWDQDHNLQTFEFDMDQFFSDQPLDAHE
ncbi:MAG: type II secretion system secretin GspD [Desulfonatronovibrionaceae bacterium]